MKDRWMMSQFADAAGEGEDVNLSPYKMLQIALVDQVAYLFDMYAVIMSKPEFSKVDVSFSQFWEVYKALVNSTNEKFLDTVTKDYTKDMIESQLLFMQDGRVFGWPLE